MEKRKGETDASVGLDAANAQVTDKNEKTRRRKMAKIRKKIMTTKKTRPRKITTKETRRRNITMKTDNRREGEGVRVYGASYAGSQKKTKIKKNHLTLRNHLALEFGSKRYGNLGKIRANAKKSMGKEGSLAKRPATHT